MFYSSNTTLRMTVPVILFFYTELNKSMIRKELEPIFKTGVAINRIQLAIESISQEQRFARENRRFDNQITASGTEIDKKLSSLSKGGTP